MTYVAKPESFEDFLAAYHLEHFSDGAVKDQWIDQYESWLEDLTQDELIELANKFAAKIRL